MGRASALVNCKLQCLSGVSKTGGLKQKKTFEGRAWPGFAFTGGNFTAFFQIGFQGSQGHGTKVVGGEKRERMEGERIKSEWGMESEGSNVSDGEVRD